MGTFKPNQISVAYQSTQVSNSVRLIFLVQREKNALFYPSDSAWILLFLVPVICIVHYSLLAKSRKLAYVCIPTKVMNEFT